MKINAIVLLLLTLVALPAGCLAAPEPVGSSARALLSDGEPCIEDTECAPTAKICGAAACVNGECGAVLLPEGAPCSTGVGVCNAVGVCGKVAGVCKEWKAWTEAPVVECVEDAECDDGLICTVDVCSNNYCTHAPLPDGAKCMYPGLSCKQGLCCVSD